MGGLAAALALAKKGFTSIDVYETASNLGFVGAGIQLAPNMARILDRLGVWADIAREAVELQETSIRRKLVLFYITSFRICSRILHCGMALQKLISYRG
jgi:2-polyprenyl-6-methoxyphenol hydroxylase-like FAD-dependent oxidoreductase